MEEKGVISITHEITAGEAAYATLFCHISKYSKQGEWLDGVLPVIYEKWPVRLLGLYCEILRAGVPMKGVPIGLYAEYAPIGNLCLSDTRQGYVSRANWFGFLPVYHGFGVILRLGAVAAGDIVVVGGMYEPIR
jgi:hypothetical protein